MVLSASLQTAKRSLELFSTGIQVAGNNTANANSEGYVREELVLQSDTPFEIDGLVLGTGAKAAGIRQKLDWFLETSIYTSNSEYFSSTQTTNTLNDLQQILGELGANDLSSSLNEFLGSLDEVINQPEVLANSQSVIAAGELLAQKVIGIREDVNQARAGMNVEIDALVEEANGLIAQIADLNPEILRLEAGGLLKSDAGGLRSQRLAAINRLSEIMPVRVQLRENGMVDVYTGNELLINQSSFRTVETYRVVDHDVAVNRVRVAQTGNEVQPTGGELGGMLTARDQTYGDFVDEFNRLAESIVYEFNRIHSQGEGREGFTEMTSQYSVSDASVSLSSSGLPYSVDHGYFDLKIVNTQSGLAETTRIQIDADGLNGDDTTMNDLVTQLDAITGLNASLSADGYLQLSTDAGVELRFSEDTSGAFAAIGLNSFFTGFDSATIGVVDHLKDNPQLLAIGFGGGEGDNQNALLLSEFATTATERLDNVSIEQFYQTQVSGIADATRAEQSIQDGHDTFLNSLLNQRDQISGVSLDEEAIRIIEFQQAYQAAARIVSTVDELFNEILRL